MSDIKVGQLRQVRDTGEVILITSIDTIPILHGEEKVVTYLTKGALECSEITWVIFKTDIIDVALTTQAV